MTGIVKTRASGRAVPSSTGHAYPAPSDSSCQQGEAQDKLAPGGWNGKGGQPGPADERAIHLCSASWMAGAGQAEGTQPQFLLPFFGCFSNLHDSFFPRLSDQLQDARNLKCPVAQGCSPQPQTAPSVLLRPFFALV